MLIELTLANNEWSSEDKGNVLISLEDIKYMKDQKDQLTSARGWHQIKVKLKDGTVYEVYGFVNELTKQLKQTLGGICSYTFPRQP